MTKPESIIGLNLDCVVVGYFAKDIVLAKILDPKMAKLGRQETQAHIIDQMNKNLGKR